MLEDRLLLWRFKLGSREAFRLIYDKYVGDLLTLATNLLGDTSSAEDAVQDVFTSFAKSVGEFRLRGSLKGYLATCVANRARDYMRRAKSRQNIAAKKTDRAAPDTAGPLQSAIHSEQLEKLSSAIARLPYEQRETLLLRLQADLRFRQIARLQKTAITTVQSRYRYGLDKLRSMLNGEVEK
ncbi:MAG: RNA polymerase sigma factor [Planctomycetota bacterium]|jgi:RNA polymerase sigma-70 factor (ECF subfamily)